MSIIILILLAVLGFWFLKGFFKYVLPVLAILFVAKLLLGVTVLTGHFILVVVGLLLVASLLRSLFARRD